MTSTSSAADTGLPDRRHFLSTLAGAGALGLPALPTLAAAPGPIEAMYPDFLRLLTAHEQAVLAMWDAEEQYVEPDRPLWHPATSEGGYVLQALPDNKCRCFLNDSDENVVRLKAIVAEPFVFDPTFAVTEQSHQRRVERARKSLDAIEAWKAEDQRRRDAAGLSAAEAAEEAVRTAKAACREAIFATKATSFREVAFQAAILTVEWHEQHITHVLERVAELAGVTPPEEFA